jgi:exodeoxyribonuclease V alpha subunit
MEYLNGVVERVTFHNEENGFSVIKVKAKGQFDLVTCVGSLSAVNVGAVLAMKGEWKNDSKFGKQFSVIDYKETLPATVAGIEKYLGSGLIKGVGPVNAKRIVAYFKEETLDIIESQPQRLIEVTGIGSKRVAVIKKAWQDQKEIKNVMLFLQSHGVSTAYAVKIYKTYGEKSLDVVNENPYKLADDIWGIGFKTADSIAQKLGILPHSPARIRSGAIYTLNFLSGEGHCFLTKEELIKESSNILELDSHLIEEVLKKMLEDKDLIADDDHIYLPPLYYSELGVARKILKLAKEESKFNTSNFEVLIEKIQEENQIKYDPIQIDAAKNALASKFMVLTGGPGTGKTTTTLAIIKLFLSVGANVILAAPTGRAAKRMSEATGMESKTIHRLLEFSPQEGFKKNEENLINCDVIIIDESSMIDIVLMYNLLKAIPDNSNVILVGDVDQLPSVGPGNVLRDIIESKALPVVKLTTIFRQALGSMIITNAHRINKGQMPILKNDKRADCFFMEGDDQNGILETIKELCHKRLPIYYKVDPIEDIQVLCPMQRGDLGARNLNIVLQGILNPEKVEIKAAGQIFKKGDKVMQIKNNYDKNVFNGDIGRISEIDFEEKSLLITFDGADVEYDVSEMDEVMLAYATTVHKSQGSEYKVVIAPIVTSHYMMLQRNLLYTAVTRAKKILVLVGSKRAIAMAVNNDKIVRRNTLLAKRLGI